jgi:large subunit ribosomal protein L29
VKGMKAADLRPRTQDELTEELDTLGKELFNLRFQRASGQLENTARVRQVRRGIARIKTILGERQRQAPQGKQHA